MKLRYGLSLVIVLAITTGPLVAADGDLVARVAFEFVPDTSLIVLPVTINDHGPFRFLLDTGATHTILSSAAADSLGFPKGREWRLATAGGDVPVDIRMLQTLKVGTAHWDNVEIVVMNADLMRMLHADGVLGGDYLRRFKLSIDYYNRVIDIAA